MILAIDTAAERCAVALWRDDAIVAARAEDMARGHAERLFPMIDEALGAAGVTLDDVRAIAVSTGPGNFTGVRVGVAAARGLALSLSASAIGVDRFECAAPAGYSGVVRLAARGGAAHLARFAGGAPTGEAATLNADEAAAFIGDSPLVEAGATDLATLARLAAARLENGERPRPRYLKPTNAALPEAPPLPILP